MLSSSRVELLALPYLGVDAALLEVEELVLPNLGGGRLVLHSTCSVSVAVAQPQVVACDEPTSNCLKLF